MNTPRQQVFTDKENQINFKTPLKTPFQNPSTRKRMLADKTNTMNTQNTGMKKNLLTSVLKKQQNAVAIKIPEFCEYTAPSMTDSKYQPEEESFFYYVAPTCSNISKSDMDLLNKIESGIIELDRFDAYYDEPKSEQEFDELDFDIEPSAFIL